MLDILPATYLSQELKEGDQLRIMFKNGGINGGATIGTVRVKTIYSNARTGLPVRFEAAWPDDPPGRTFSYRFDEITILQVFSRSRAAEIVSFLNDLLLIDRKAIAVLLSVRVACEKGFAEHPTLQVNADDGKAGRYTISALGLLNGLFGTREADGFGWIVAVYEDGELKRFELAPISA